MDDAWRPGVPVDPHLAPQWDRSALLRDVEPGDVEA